MDLFEVCITDPALTQIEAYDCNPCTTTQSGIQTRSKRLKEAYTLVVRKKKFCEINGNSNLKKKFCGTKCNSLQIRLQHVRGNDLIS